jgi:hypothetical protein
MSLNRSNIQRHSRCASAVHCTTFKEPLKEVVLIATVQFGRETGRSPNLKSGVLILHWLRSQECRSLHILGLVLKRTLPGHENRAEYGGI